MRITPDRRGSKAKAYAIVHAAKRKGHDMYCLVIKGQNGFGVLSM